MACPSTVWSAERRDGTGWVRSGACLARCGAKWPSGPWQGKERDAKASGMERRARALQSAVWCGAVWIAELVRGRCLEWLALVWFGEERAERPVWSWFGLAGK